jgi:hypothetical protein
MIFRRNAESLAVLLSWLCVVWSAAAHAQMVPASKSTSRDSATSMRQLFEFHNSFWVNLHQTLLEEALVSNGAADRRLQSNTLLATSQMSSQEKSDWDTAVAFYATRFGTSRQHGNDELIDLNDALARMSDNGGDLRSQNLKGPLVAALLSAAPVFRKYWWHGQEQSNAKWIASQRDTLQRIGPRLAFVLTKDLRQPWPARPIRVDVCYYVPEIGFAFTILPPHITYASGDGSHQGLLGFELLFHEASHTFADVESDALSNACRTHAKDCGDLWHTLLFYTSGVELGRLLPAPDQISFMPYAYKYGLYTRGAWPRYYRVLLTDWKPYLEGNTTFQAAMDGMAAHLEE